MGIENDQQHKLPKKFFILFAFCWTLFKWKARTNSRTDIGITYSIKQRQKKKWIWIAEVGMCLELMFFKPHTNNIFQEKRKKKQQKQKNKTVIYVTSFENGFIKNT